MKEKLLKNFAATFGDSADTKAYFAPGRVNLIGEHTDYNGGHVFPCALSMGTYGVARKRNDRQMRFYSVNQAHRGIIETSLDELKANEPTGWANYPMGVVWALAEKGYKIGQGVDMLIHGTIPSGSGLSSSASLEVLTGFILNDLFGLGISNQDIALIGQYAENHYIGVNCGIMDQFAIAMGKKDHAIFLDTADLSFEYAPLNLAGAQIVIANTNKKRGLTDSKYNERRQECEQALAQIKQAMGENPGINALGDLDEDDFEQYKTAITNAVWMKRAKHAVHENQRTIRAVAALKANDISLFGTLMNESHISLRDDYAVTGTELDTLVLAAWAQSGVIGARMTGAGFGGCAVSIVEGTAVDGFISGVGTAYEKEIGYAADFYVAQVGGGPVVL